VIVTLTIPHNPYQLPGSGYLGEELSEIIYQGIMGEDPDEPLLGVN